MSLISTPKPPQHGQAFWVVLGLTLLFSWPLTADPTTRVRGNLQGDGPMFYWNLCWVGAALHEGQNPLFCPELFAPYGADLRLHTLTLANSIPGGWLAAWIGPALSMNLLYLLQTLLAAWGGWRLARALGLGQTEALYLACALAFHPYRIAHGGQLNLFSTGSLVLTLALLLQSVAGHWRSAVGVGLLWALTGLHEWYYAVYVGIAGILLVLFSRQGRLFQRSLRFGLAACVALACLTPVLIPMLDTAEDVGMVRAGGTRAVPLEAYGTLSPNHPLWPSASRRAGADDDSFKSYAESTVTIGLTPFLLVGLGLLGIRSARRNQSKSLETGLPEMAVLEWRVLAAWTVLGIWLSLGPQPMALGIRLPIGFLSEAWSQLPLFSHVRVPSRWGLLANLGLLSLAAIGLSRCSRKLQILALAALLFEYLPIPVSNFDVRPSAQTAAVLDELERLPAGGLIHVPALDKRYLIYQPLHRRPIADGFVARLDPRIQEAQRLLQPYFRNLPRRNQRAARFTEAFLRWRGIRILWLDQAHLDPDRFEVWRRAILQDFPNVRETGHPALLLLAEATETPAPTPQSLVLNGPPRLDRCLDGPLELALLLPEETGRSVRLGLVLQGGNPPGGLTVQVDQRVVLERPSVVGRQELSLDLGLLEPGPHRLTLTPVGSRRGGPCGLQLAEATVTMAGQPAPVFRFASGRDPAGDAD